MYSALDKQSVLMAEPLANVLMLDHDPATCAAQHVDLHVKKYVAVYARLLSSVWHNYHNPYVFPVDQPPPHGDLITLWVPPAAYRTPTLAYRLDDGDVYTGDRSHYRVAGRRILDRGWEGYPMAQWTGACRGNYVWLRTVALYLCDEHRNRFGKPHTCEPIVHNLELMPPSLDDTSSDFTEVSPMVGPEALVVEGGYSDAVASYRRNYLLNMKPILEWSNGAPDWYTAEGGHH